MTTNSRVHIRAGVLVAFALICLGIFLLLLNIAGGLSIGAKYDFETVVPTAVQLVPGADVRDAGINVGKVTAISNRGTSAVVAMALDKKRGPVYRDGTVRVRTKTIVGENYIELNPGTPTAGPIPHGGALPIAQAQDAVQLDEILSTLDAPRRARLQALLRSFGGGLHRADDQLNQTLDALSSTVDTAGPVAQALADQSQQLGSLVDDLGTVFSALGNRATDIGTLSSAGMRTAAILAGQAAAMRQTLRALPPTLTQAQVTTARLAAVGTTATPVLDNLGSALSALTPALKVLPSAGAATISALDRLHAVTPVASRLLRSLKAVAPLAEAATTPLDTLVRQLLPAIGYLGPYAEDAAHLLYEIDSAGTGHDATGYLAKLLPVIASSTLTTLTPDERQALQALQALGIAQRINFAGSNAYPAPGTGEHPAPLSSTYPHVK
jgi:phospholipid/cholesterol/gamma-HCH transport system substrate-binding protein